MKRIVLINLAILSLAVFFSIGWGNKNQSQDPLFVLAPDSPIEVGPGSGEVVLADLNCDRHLDLLTKHLLSTSMVVRFGDGNGHFAPVESPLIFGYPPGATRLGDVNHDGILDLGVASRDGNAEYVHILLGNCEGGFSPVSGSPFATSASTEFYKPNLSFMDVNEDENPDIVMANARRNSIEILFGDGRGGFSPGPIVSLEPGQGYNSFALGDVDGDGHLDLVTTSGAMVGGDPGYLLIKRGDGKGAFADTFGPPLTLPPTPRVGTLADMNGDQKLDIVLTHGNHSSVLMNSGAGIFTPAPASPYDIGAQAFAVVAADANGDRRNDLVAATVNSITVLLGDSRGFALAPGSPYPAGPGAYNVTVGDLNEDGKLDVAASSFESSAVTVLLGR